jgi:hypothetical protein
MKSGESAGSISCTGYRLHSPYHPEGEVRLGQSTIGISELVWGCGLCPGSTLLVKRCTFSSVGPFDESLRRLEDWDWLLRCAQMMGIPVVQRVLSVVHVSWRASYTLDHVSDAATKIRENITGGGYLLDRGQRATMLATLFIELAATAYQNGNYVGAARWMLMSIYYRPFKRRDFYRRVLKAIRSDLLKSWLSEEREQSSPTSSEVSEKTVTLRREDTPTETEKRSGAATNRRAC